MKPEGGIMPEDGSQPAGGVGEPSDRARRWEQRQHLRCLEFAVYDGYDIKAEDYVNIPRDLRAIAKDENASPRDRIRAAEALVFLEQKRIDRAIELDKIMRLDNNAATERVELTVDLPDGALEAVAKSIASPAPAPSCPPKRKRK